MAAPPAPVPSRSNILYSLSILAGYQSECEAGKRNVQVAMSHPLRAIMLSVCATGWPWIVHCELRCAAAKSRGILGIRRN